MTDPKAPLPASWPDAKPSSRFPAHEARESAIRILTDAYAYDAITELEFERRLRRLSVAASGLDIGAIVADLPVLGTTDGRSSGRPLPTRQSRIIGFMSDVHRTGPWLVPEAPSIRAVLCNMTIDLRYAVIPPACTIEVTALMAAVLILCHPASRWNSTCSRFSLAWVATPMEAQWAGMMRRTCGWWAVH